MSSETFLENQERMFSILVVDDIPENLQLISDIIYHEGLDIIVATNGKQAINTAYLKRPDLILLDIAMPEMDGYEVCTILKSKQKTKDIPVIFLTAKVETEDIIQGFEVGAVDYVTKPFNRAKLIARIQTHLKIVHQREIIKNLNYSLEKKVEKRTEQLGKSVQRLLKSNKRYSLVNKELKFYSASPK